MAGNIDNRIKISYITTFCHGGGKKEERCEF
jgi:hypothetical protein